MTRGVVQPVNPMRQPATAVQRRLFDFVCAEGLRGLPPTQQEIADHMGWSGNSRAREVVEALMRKGWLVMAPDLARSIVPVIYSEE